MLLLVAYLGGVLTILSPCILPVLPFVFARVDQSFLKVTLPMLIGMATTFAIVATLAAFGGGWAVAANDYGHYGALALLALFGATLLSVRLTAILTRPAIAMANRLLNSTGGPASAPSLGGSLLLGVATGLLWAPCAGPILGLMLTGAALQGATIETSFLLLAYAAGAATSLALALLIGGRVFAAMKHLLGAGEWLKRSLGAAVIAGVATIGLGFDQGLLARLSGFGTAKVEQALLDVLTLGRNETMPSASATELRPALPVEGRIASLDGAVTWLNSPPLTAEQLRGKVVLIDFWTYSCINCIRTLPFVKAWDERYRSQGLVVIGVHTPEFAFEKNLDNVRKAVARFGIKFPVALDSNYGIWNAFRNSYWPARYIVDAEGRVRYHYFGEGDYEKTTKVIEQLLEEAGQGTAADISLTVHATREEAAPDLRNVHSSETYVGYRQGSNFASNERVTRDAPQDYSLAELGVNEWGLAGNWTVRGDKAVLNQPGGGIGYRFNARDLHLVLGAGAAGKPVRFQVTIDGKAPGESHGADTDADGNGVVTDTRLYQLARQAGTIGARRFEIRFLEAGAEAYAFTFG